MIVFLAGSFHTPDEEKFLEDIYELLTDKGYDVWWAPKQVERCYESKDSDLLERVNKTEERAIEESDILVAVMRGASFGTAFEIKHAFDNDINIIGYIAKDSPQFNSGAFKYRVSTIVRSNEELLAKLKDLEKTTKSFDHIRDFL